MAPRGLLVPPWYVTEVLEDNIMHACSIIWGFSLCSAMFSATKASRQSYSAYKKGKLFTAYPIMVWSEWIASVVISVLSWLFLKGALAARSVLFLYCLRLFDYLADRLEASGYFSSSVGIPIQTSSPTMIGRLLTKLCSGILGNSDAMHPSDHHQ
jgi:hypothetical protein